MLYLLHLPRRRKRDPKAPERARRGLRYPPLRPRRRLFQAPLVRSRNPTRVTRQLRTKPARPFVGRSFLSGISVLTSDSNSPIGRATSLQGFSQFLVHGVSSGAGAGPLEMSFLRTVSQPLFPAPLASSSKFAPLCARLIPPAPAAGRSCAA